MTPARELVELDPGEILVSERLRDVDDAWAEAIAASMEQKGQDTPIQVRRNGEGKLHLVAGAHRLEACKKAGVSVRAEIIVCNELEARLIEIDENLFRHELNALDRAVFLAERKAIYEEMFPETKHGAQGGRGGKKIENDIMSFSKETADRIGLTERSVQRAIKIAKNIPADIRQRLANTEIADRQVDLLYLASLPAATQRKAVSLYIDGEARDIKTAVARATGNEEPEPTPAEKQLQCLLDHWARAGKTVQTKFLFHLRETGFLEGVNGPSKPL